MQLRGGRSLTSGPSAQSKGIAKGKGKGKPTWKSGYFVDAHESNDWCDGVGSYGHDSHYESYAPEMNVGLLGMVDPVEEDEPQEEYEEHEEIEEWEATCLNAVSELGEDLSDYDVSVIGDALQHELAALKAFGKAKGKGKSKAKGKGKGKGKGKLVKSNLTLEQRRAKLSEIKARSKCMRCGATGHWAGDPACKFPNRPQTSQPRAAMLACMSDSSSDDGDCVILTPGHSSTPVAMMGYSVVRGRPKGTPKPTAKPSGAIA